MRITKQVLRVGVVAAAMVVPALTVPTAAHAVEAGKAEVAWKQIQYAGGSSDNKVQLSAIDGYYVIDDEIPIVPGRGCWRAPGYDDTIVHCEATGIDQIYLDLGAGQDWLGRRHVAPTLKVPLTVLGGADQDTLYGELGNDHIDGGAGDDFLHGRAGNDRITGSSTGDDGMNIVLGGDGDDALYGGADYDVCVNGPNFQACERF